MPPNQPALPVGSIVTLVGAAQGFSGDGAPANSAALNGPSGLALTADGGYLIADTDNHVVRKVWPDGIITTVAGTPRQNGKSGDKGPATDARLNRPNGVCATADGGFLVADTGNNMIRKVGTDGIISTVAGTGFKGLGYNDVNALQADLSGPTDVVETRDKGFLIADWGNHLVRKVAADGTITSVVGVGSTTMRPSSVALTSDGGYLVVDGGASQVLKVSPDKAITSAAGAPVFNGDPVDVPGPAMAAQIRPEAVAVAPDGSFFVIAEQHIDRVSKVSNGQINTIAGRAGAFHGDEGSMNPSGAGDGGPAIAALLNGPAAIVVTSTGDIVFAEKHTHRIRKIGSVPIQQRPNLPVVASGSGFQLTAEQDLVSFSGRHYLRFQGDGNLCIYDASLRYVWGLDTALGPSFSGAKGGTAIFTGNGNFLITSVNGSAIWQTNTAGNPGARLGIDEQGRMLITSSSGRQLWSSKS